MQGLYGAESLKIKKRLYRLHAKAPRPDDYDEHGFDVPKFAKTFHERDLEVKEFTNDFFVRDVEVEIKFLVLLFSLQTLFINEWT